MLKPLLLGAALAAAVAAPGAEPVNRLALDLVATAEHPRNSEGAFATLRSGGIIFCYSQFSGGTSDFSSSRLAEVTSADQGRTWSRPRVMFQPVGDAQEMSVSLLGGTRLMLFSAIKHGTRECRPYVRCSDDDGAHWTEPRALFRAPGYFVLNNDRVIRTSRGRIIVPLAYHRALPRPATGEWGVDLHGIALWLYSDDDGATWTESPTWWTLPVASGTGLQEPGVVELADGSLYAWARTDRGCQYEFRSTDGGTTWDPPRPSALRSPASPASIKRVPHSGDLMAIVNDYSGQFPFSLPANPYRGRSPLVATFSSDGGRSWGGAKLLEGDPAGNFCYTAIEYTGDAVLLGYGAVGGSSGSPWSLRVRRLALPWLRAPEDEPTRSGRETLHAILDQDKTWVKIHAAEALLAGGEASELRARFLRLVPTVDALPYRVGVWRVLANTSATADERAAAVEAVERIYLNPASTDRSQAIETLCKLRVAPEGPILEAVRRGADSGPALLRPLSLWSLALSGEPGALGRLCALLRSPDVAMRVDAAYALRWLRTTDPQALRALAAAAAREPRGTRAHPYLMSAAFALRADPAQRGRWRAALDAILEKGTGEARFEACQGLRPDATVADLGRYERLLADPEPDTRVGAAGTLFYVHARQ